jgi:hypothetical protein
MHASFSTCLPEAHAKQESRDVFPNRDADTCSHLSTLPPLSGLVFAACAGQHNAAG